MLIGAKSNLARLMATENIIIEQKNVETAYFDLNNRKLVIPILDSELSPELYDLFLGHEVGHALETPYEGWHHSIVDLKVIKSILNVCEDIRIEKKIKRKYPGIRYSFIKGYNELLEKDFFGINNTNINTLNYIDRLNLFTKCGATLGIEFSEEEMELTKEAESTETFEDVVKIAQKIQEFMKEKLIDDFESKSMKTVIVLTDGDGDGESEGEGEGEEPFGLSDADLDNAIIIDERDSSEKSDNKSKSGQIGKPKTIPSTSGNKTPTSNYTPPDELLESRTDNSFRNREKELIDHSVSDDIEYLKIPQKQDLDGLIVDYKSLYNQINAYQNKFDYGIFNMEGMKTGFNEFKKESNKVVSYLVKEFELKKNADQMKRAKVSKTGELNMSRLHDYKFTDDIFLRLTKIPEGKSHGLVMYIDWSGSMEYNIDATIKQLINLTLFCRKVNIPYEVYAFSSFSHQYFVNPEDQYLSKPGLKALDTSEGTVWANGAILLNVLSSKMNNKEYTEACCYLLHYKGSATAGMHKNKYYQCPDFFRLGGTPLNDAIITAFDIVPKFKKDNKLQIVNTVFLTDGESSGLSSRYDKNGNLKSIYSSRNSVFVDPITKAQVRVESRFGYSNVNQTVGLLRLLKERIESNLIGFFICSTSSARSGLEEYIKGDMAKIDKMLSEFRKNSSTTLHKLGGYDEYYFLNSGKLDIEDVEFEATAVTNRGLASEFSKYNGNKINNRVILSRFINLIT